MECSALFASFWGLIQSISIFCFGLNAIIGNEDPSGCVCKSVEPGSVYYEILNSFCELGYGARYLVFNTAIPTTLIALVYMILNGLLCYGLIKKKRKFICIWQFGNYLLTIALLFIALYVSYFLFNFSQYFFPICIVIVLIYYIWETYRNKLKKHSVTKDGIALSMFEDIVLVISKFLQILGLPTFSITRSLQQFFLTVGQNNFGKFMSSTNYFNH